MSSVGGRVLCNVGQVDLVRSGRKQRTAESSCAVGCLATFVSADMNWLESGAIFSLTLLDFRKEQSS